MKYYLRPSTRLFFCLVIIPAFLILSSGGAKAAGGTLHIFMSELAIEKVRDPDLARLLENKRDVVLWASWYPDSGYAGDNQYGEYSHWTEFLDGYADYIKKETPPGHAEFEFLAAHLLGASAHSMQDQVFDKLFLEKTMEVDGTGQETLDRGLDMVCMHDYQRHKLALPAKVLVKKTRYTPVRHLGRVYRRLGKKYDHIRGQISRGQRLLALALTGEKLIHGIEHNSVRRLSPWATQNYYSAPGGIEHNAEITAAYWEALWNKLHGGMRDFVIATFPRDGEHVLSTDHNSVDSNVFVFLNRRYDGETITGDTVYIEDENGVRVEGSFGWCYGHNMLRIMPSENLSPGKQYTVTLTTGVADIYGSHMAEDYSFVFTAPQV